MNKLLFALFSAILFTTLPALAGGLPEGSKAPDFKAKNQDGKTVHLAETKGKPVLLFFYPKDDTPGCTKEACSFRDEFKKFKDLGAVIYGISRQNSESHKEFRNKHKLPFDLLVDEDGSIAKLYGVNLMKVVGFHSRQSVLIGPDGKVAKFYEQVDPATHALETYKDVQELLKKR